MNGDTKKRIQAFRLLGLLLLILTTVLAGACDSSSDRILIPGNGDGDVDSDADGDADGDSDSDSDADGDNSLTGSMWYPIEDYEENYDSCGQVIRAIFRDFSADHPDFERVNLGWGPLQGCLDDELGADKKPRMSDIWGNKQVVDSACQESCPNGGDLGVARLVSTDGWSDNWANSAKDPTQYTIPPPMFESASTFNDWYNDVEGTNIRVEKWLSLEEESEGVFVFDSKAFFPVEKDEGFKAESGQNDESGTNHNFLFTTEVHLKFPYEGGERFTFRGDDDLWIFVNDRLALDLGGLHWPFEGTIDFDRLAGQLGITPGNKYDMDIFHAERHTKASNFRIETNISCFVNVVAE